MLRSLDISPLFNTPLELKPVGFYSHWRPYFYGNLDPSQFVIDSVDLEVKFQQSIKTTVKSDHPKGGKSSKKSSKTSSVKTKSKSDPLKSASPEFDTNTVVYWLSQARGILLASGGSLTPALVAKMVQFLRKAYDLSVESRERAQLAYVLRTLGHPPTLEGQEGEPEDELHAVLMEFDGGHGPTMVYASSDSFACAYWNRGGKKWSRFDRGEGSELAVRLCKVAREVLSKFPSDPSSEASSDGGELPSLPSVENIRFSVISSSGIKTVLVEKSLVSDSGFGGLYNGFAALFNVLVGRDFDHRKHGTSGLVGAVDTDQYPLKLESSRRSYKFAPISNRCFAFFVDCFLLSGVLGVFYYFISPIVGTWGIIPSTVLYILLCLFVPLLLAWMESCPEWGHATIGKKLMGVHVHGVDSPHISFSQALTRNMSKFVLGPMFLFSGYAWAIFHPFKRTWHDLLSDTVVLEGPLKLSLLAEFGEDGVYRDSQETPEGSRGAVSSSQE